MAYRGGALPWIACTFLFVVAAIFGGLWFSRETKILALDKELKTATYKVLIAEPWNNQSVNDLLTENVRIKDDIQKWKDEAIKQQNKFEVRNALWGEEKGRASEAHRKLAVRIKEVEFKTARITALEASNLEIRNTREVKAEADVAEAKELYNNAVKRSQKLSSDLQLAEEREQNLRGAYQTRIMEIQRVNSGLQRVIEKIQKESNRDKAIKTEQYDGKIIEADIQNKFIVINLGKAHKVYRGLRFDVIRWRFNRWDYMGAIELTKIGATTSNGVILNSIQAKKYCPLTGYIAKSPEEKYSPYAATGANMNQVVELIKADVEEKASMKAMDPIVIGDFITNPLYSNSRILNFVVAGEPVKSKHSIAEIKQLIKQHGGVVQETVEVSTDFLVLGKIPDENSVAESEEAKRRRAIAVKARTKAREYGIPIMLEVELFNFMRY